MPRCTEGGVPPVRVSWSTPSLCPAAHDTDALRERAELLYEAEVKAHTTLQARKHGSDHRMMKKLLSAGTVKDKIAALTVQVQESSFHCLPHVRSLLSLAERPRPEVKLAATEALTDLFLQRLLPPRGLKSFERAALPAAALARGAAADAGKALPAETLRVLLQAYLEGELKEMYSRLVELVEATTGSASERHSKRHEHIHREQRRFTEEAAKLTQNLQKKPSVRSVEKVKGWSL